MRYTLDELQLCLLAGTETGCDIARFGASVSALGETLSGNGLRLYRAVFGG